MQRRVDLSLPIELVTIREMTAAMLVAAEKKRWTEVQRIDDARLKLLHTIPAEMFRASDEAARELLQEILSATRQIEQQAVVERSMSGDELKRTNQRQHAAKAYGFNSAVV